MQLIVTGAHGFDITLKFKKRLCSLWSHLKFKVLHGPIHLSIHVLRWCLAKQSQPSMPCGVLQSSNKVSPSLTFCGQLLYCAQAVLHATHFLFDISPPGSLWSSSLSFSFGCPSYGCFRDENTNQGIIGKCTFICLITRKFLSSFMEALNTGLMISELLGLIIVFDM